MKTKLTRTLMALAMCGATMAAAERQTLRMEAPAVSARLERIQPLPATNRLRLAIGLPWRNQDALTNLFHQLYDPASTNFHRFLTPAQFVEQFGPTEQDYQSVIDYARSNRLEVLGTFGNRALVDVAGSVADIEGAFRVHLGEYAHPTENRRFFSPDVEPSVEPGLHISFVSGLDNYTIPHHDGHGTPIVMPEGGSDSMDTNLYVGLDFRNAYVPGTALTGAGQVVGMFELGGYAPSDIQTYETYAGLPSVPLNNVLGSEPAGFANNEVASDIELVIAMAPGLSVVNVYEGYITNPPEPVMNEIAYPSKGEVRPNQVSCSWSIEANTNVTPALIEMAVQGMSFLKSSGDFGAYPNGVNPGTLQNFKYMTAVGGTKLVMNGYGASWKSETVWHTSFSTNFSMGASAGGICTQVGIPDYQKTVSMALNNGSTQYRNIPDVAMVAQDIRIVATSQPTNGPPVPDTFYAWEGTSAATPLWAGFVALANQQAAAEGKPPLGFLNPALYNIAGGPLYAACFHDITKGNNIWTNGTFGTSSGGLYSAAPGYDLCTGWGSPAGTALIDALAGFSGPVFVDFNNIAIGDGTYEHPFSTMAQGTNAVKVRGTIIIKTAGSSSETMTIAKPMTITASDGAATIGH